MGLEQFGPATCGGGRLTRQADVGFNSTAKAGLPDADRLAVPDNSRNVPSLSDRTHWSIKAYTEFGRDWPARGQVT